MFLLRERSLQWEKFFEEQTRKNQADSKRIDPMYDEANEIYNKAKAAVSELLGENLSEYPFDEDNDSLVEDDVSNSIDSYDDAVSECDSASDDCLIEDSESRCEDESVGERGSEDESGSVDAGAEIQSSVVIKLLEMESEGDCVQTDVGSGFCSYETFGLDFSTQRKRPYHSKTATDENLESRNTNLGNPLECADSPSLTIQVKKSGARTSGSYSRIKSKLRYSKKVPGLKSTISVEKGSYQLSDDRKRGSVYGEVNQNQDFMYKWLNGSESFSDISSCDLLPVGGDFRFPDHLSSVDDNCSTLVGVNAQDESVSGLEGKAHSGTHYEWNGDQRLHFTSWWLNTVDGNEKYSDSCENLSLDFDPFITCECEENCPLRAGFGQSSSMAPSVVQEELQEQIDNLDEVLDGQDVLYLSSESAKAIDETQNVKSLSVVPRKKRRFTLQR